MSLAVEFVHLFAFPPCVSWRAAFRAHLEVFVFGAVAGVVKVKWGAYAISARSFGRSSPVSLAFEPVVE